MLGAVSYAYDWSTLRVPFLTISHSGKVFADRQKGPILSDGPILESLLNRQLRNTSNGIVKIEDNPVRVNHRCPCRNKPTH